MDIHLVFSEIDAGGKVEIILCWLIIASICFVYVLVLSLTVIEIYSNITDLHFHALLQKLTPCAHTPVRCPVQSQPDENQRDTRSEYNIHITTTWCD